MPQLKSTSGITLDWLRAERTVEEGECWLWTRAMGGAKRETPVMWHGGRVKAAYVVAWLLHKGLDEVPDGISLWRGCRNMRCINPQCVMAGSTAKQRAWLSKRGAYKASPARRAAITVRVRNSTAKLIGGMEAARLIRASDEPPKVLAARHGVSVSCVSKIQCHRTWAESVIPAASVFSMGVAKR